MPRPQCCSRSSELRQGGRHPSVPAPRPNSSSPGAPNHHPTRGAEREAGEAGFRLRGSFSLTGSCPGRSPAPGALAPRTQPSAALRRSWACLSSPQLCVPSPGPAHSPGLESRRSTCLTCLTSSSLRPPGPQVSAPALPVLSFRALGLLAAPPPAGAEPPRPSPAASRPPSPLPAEVSSPPMSGAADPGLRGAEGGGP